MGVKEKPRMISCMEKNTGENFGNLENIITFARNKNQPKYNYEEI